MQSELKHAIQQAASEIAIVVAAEMGDGTIAKRYSGDWRSDARRHVASRLIPAMFTIAEQTVTRQASEMADRICDQVERRVGEKSRTSYLKASDCGTGAGGFKPGNTCAREGGTSNADQTDTPEFKAWFGDSKVVDENGEPLMVYHGTNQPISEFSDERHGENTASASSIAFFFTENPDEANEYAELAGRKQIANAVDTEKASAELQKKISKAENKGDWDTAEKLYLELENLELGAINADPSGQSIVPVFAKTETPLVIDMNGAFNGHQVRDAIHDAKERGFDGLKLLNVYDTLTPEQRDVLKSLRGKFRSGNSKKNQSE